MDVISLQSRVKTGYVGNAIAVPTLNACGVHAVAVDTVIYAHHPGHGPVTPERISPADLSARLETAFSDSHPPACLLSGYLASVDQGHAALQQLQRARHDGRLQAYYLDPVFGDDAEGTYVDPALVAFYRDMALPACNVLTPNRYELAQLSGMPVENIGDAETAARAMIVKGPDTVVVSSVPGPGGRIANVLVSRDAACAVSVDSLKLRAKGTGDMLSAAFCGLHAQGIAPDDALGMAVALVDATAKDAALSNADELNPLKILNNFDFPLK
jgi:pyridoxine kinase